MIQRHVQVAAHSPSARWQRLDTALALALAAIAAIWHAMLMTRATNDNFLHLTFAQQWLHGDWPVRDFYDQGWVLQYALSAAARLVFGDRLAGEAFIIGLCWAASAFLVYVVVHRLTGGRTASAASALLLIVAGARGYSYPKGIVYAVAASLWWRYFDRPTFGRLLAFATWVAMAFYWRPDHGVYVAIGLTLAVIAAHGVTQAALTRSAIAGAVAIAWAVPFLIYVQLSYGLVEYVETELTQAEVEHASHGTHEWPILRYASNLITFEPAARYAPIVAVRWSGSSTSAQREQLRRRYGLTPVATDADGLERVRLSSSSLPQVRALVNEPLIDDTAGIDRSAGTVTEKDWPGYQRRKFAYPLLRLQLLPGLDARTRASEFVAAFFLGFPLALLVAARWVSRRLAGPPPRAFALFAVFALLVAWAMVRNPFPARVADAVVLSSIACGCCLAAAWRRVEHHPMRTGVLRLVASIVGVVVLASTAVAGRFDNPRVWLRDGVQAYRELSASPPLAFYRDRPARFPLRLAAYVRDCVPATERVLVLWFEPEIYYFSDRLMAQRHAVFAPAWAGLAPEQRATLAKVERSRPPIVLARQSSLNAEARATFPAIVAYVEREYRVAATVEDAGEEYLLYARRDRPAVRTFATEPWPCFTSMESTWASVGRTAQ